MGAAGPAAREPRPASGAPGNRRDAIRGHAEALGFDVIRFAEADLDPSAAAHLEEFVDRGCHGDMAWMATTRDRRGHPRALWPEARSAVVVGLNYGPADDPLGLIGKGERATVSAYARGRDYHDVVKKRLKALGRWMAQSFACRVKVFVDTAPLMEKPLAQRAGVGWQGKHTNLVSRAFGSWLFLGVVLTDLAVEPDAPGTDRCGACRRCLDVCPTDAFPAPYRLDARRCISYLTIEHKGHIPAEFRAPMGNRVYGCDDCLAVCPWNKFARQTREHAFLPRLELTAPLLADFAALDDAGFRKVFRGSPVKRVGRDRFVRNVLIALGNSGDAGAAGAVEPHLDEASPVVRAMAVWALSRLLDAAAFGRLRARRLPAEPDPDVRAEWAS